MSNSLFGSVQSKRMTTSCNKKLGHGYTELRWVPLTGNCFLTVCAVVLYLLFDRHPAGVSVSLLSYRVDQLPHWRQLHHGQLHLSWIKTLNRLRGTHTNTQYKNTFFGPQTKIRTEWSQDYINYTVYSFVSFVILDQNDKFHLDN